MLEHGVGLTLAVVLQVKVRYIIIVDLHILGLWFTDLLLNLFFLLILFVAHHGRCWCRFERMVGA
jgi:hypothetical protein